MDSAGSETCEVAPMDERSGGRFSRHSKKIRTEGSLGPGTLCEFAHYR
jgi:hypothetical protein